MFELCLFLLFVSGLYAREVGTLFAFYGWVLFIIVLLGLYFAWYFPRMMRRARYRKAKKSRFHRFVRED